MQNFDLYGDIARRTGGDIYVGVVGPVRTGKSTFLSRFLETMILPNIEDPAKRAETADQTPQSGSGKTVTTTEPKFVPAEAVTVNFGGEGGVASARVRLIDCVGYLVDGALGTEENGASRRVKTPWSEEEMPFSLAAELGTQKVIRDHSTVAVLVTTDGSFTDLPRENYIAAEERVARELKAAKKPFVVLLNVKDPESERAKTLRDGLSEKYGVPVLLFSALTAGEAEFSALLERILYEFPLSDLHFSLPDWVETLPEDSPMVASVLSKLRSVAQSAEKMRDYALFEAVFTDEDPVENPVLSALSPATGSASFEVSAKPGVFLRVLSEECGENLGSECDLMQYCRGLSRAKREYEKLESALLEVQEKGYGVVVPNLGDTRLEEPKLVKQGGGYGLKLRATAPSLHIMQVDVSTEISPVVGSEAQSREMADYLKSEYERDPAAVWQTNLFGKSLHSMVLEGLDRKVTAMPEETRKKMRKTVTRIVNEGKGGVLCILL